MYIDKPYSCTHIKYIYVNKRIRCLSCLRLFIGSRKWFWIETRQAVFLWCDLDTNPERLRKPLSLRRNANLYSYWGSSCNCNSTARPYDERSFNTPHTIAKVSLPVALPMHADINIFVSFTITLTPYVPFVPCYQVLGVAICSTTSCWGVMTLYGFIKLGLYCVEQRFVSYWND